MPVPFGHHHFRIVTSVLLFTIYSWIVNNGSGNPACCRDPLSLNASGVAAQEQQEFELAVVGQLGGVVSVIATGDQAGLIFVGLGSRVASVDISNPRQPQLLGLSPTLPDYVESIDAAGDFLVAEGRGSVYIIDVSDSSQPELLSTLHPWGPGPVTKADRYGDSMHSGSVAADAPMRPSSLVNDVRQLAVIGENVVLLFDYGVVVFDLSDPTNPIMRNKFIEFDFLLGSCEALTVLAMRAYVACETQVHTIDISNLANLTVLGSFAYSLDSNSVSAISLTTDSVVVAASTGIFVIDITNPSTPNTKSFIATSEAPRDLIAVDERLYITIPNQGVFLFDPRDAMPAEPRALYVSKGRPLGLALVGSQLIVADGGAGLLILDISSTTALDLVGTSNLQGAASYAHDITVRGTTAYLAAQEGGLQIISIEDLTRPSLISTLETDALISALDIDGATVVLAGIAGELELGDITDPQRPKKLGRTTVGGRGYAVAAQDGWAYVATGSEGLVIVDISNPNAPRVTGTIDCWAYAIAIDGDTAAIGTRDGTMIVDIATPESPIVLALDETNRWTRGLAIRASTVFVADSCEGLRILDISNRSEPQILATLDHNGCFDGMTVAGNLVLMLDEGFEGVYIADITIPTAPRKRGSIMSPGSPNRLASVAASEGAADGYAVLANGDAGLVAIRYRPPATLVPKSLEWPAEALKLGVLELLIQYYDREGDRPTPMGLLAPSSAAKLAQAVTDPDSLWESLGDFSDPSAGAYASRSPACHAASGVGIIDCSGMRLALASKIRYSGGLSLFDRDRGFGSNSDLVLLAGQFALYHAFVRDFDAPLSGTYTASDTRAPRDYKRYHERLIQAYERHMRSLLVGMISETRQDAGFQLALTRSAGWLLTPYVRTIQALEEYQAWASPSDRAAAMAVVNALDQRIWWEWVVPQPKGPRTAGKASLGHQATFDAWLEREPSLVGRDRTTYMGGSLPSLRPDALALAPFDGLWFDADFTIPGEWYCKQRFHPAGGQDWQRCMALARQESLDGDKSPFGQFYGSEDCNARQDGRASVDCGETNLGSMAEEWLGTYVGARAGLRLIEQVVARQDPAAPQGALPPGAYGTVTERLGYGVAGFHGGEGRQDDLEWTFEQPTGGVQAIRTLSGARHDGETQNGRNSLGEVDTVPGRNAGNNGDAWTGTGEEYPGAIENHLPGPNPLYAAVIASQVLGDKVAGGMSPSLYDAVHRNHPDEFESWVWLLQSSMYRCRGVDDPVDPACFAFSTDHWPYPAEIKREALFTHPQDAGVPAALRYFWKDAPGLLSDTVIGESQVQGGDDWCSPSSGLVFGRVPELGGSADRYLVTEGGFGSYNLILQTAGAFMRLAAARSEENAPSPELAEAWRIQQEEVLEPWYTEMQGLVEDILELYGEGGIGYIPDAENVACIAGAGAGRAPLTHRGSGRATIESAIAQRARWYSAASLWYWWYDSEWLDVD